MTGTNKSINKYIYEKLATVTDRIRIAVRVINFPFTSLAFMQHMHDSGCSADDVNTLVTAKLLLYSTIESFTIT